ncbi:MAG: LacI family DNA-binding transcriptional regulator [Chloroflexi bacterium]|nr:LacI family DNA-binding transcriptional regulator [Chloroflexota bacterium]
MSSPKNQPTRPTIIHVARAAGVSKSTVSRVLQGDAASVKAETRQAVTRAIHKLGYEHNAIASSLRTARTNTVMLIAPDIANPFWSEVTRGLQDTMEHAGYSVVVGNGDWDPHRENQFLKTARRNRFDGVAINPTTIHCRELRATGIPTVILGIRDGFPQIDMVGSDSYRGTLDALTYLYQKGHRRIGFIHGRYDTDPGHARYQAYTDFVKQHNLRLDPTFIVQVPFDRAGGERGMQTLLSLPKPPTAVFASNDILAIAAMQRAAQLDVKIPADISIIGMDDIYPASMMTPPLTTMAKQKYEIGCQAAQFLIERIAGNAPREGRRCVLPCTLIERGTVAPLHT